MVAVFVRSSAAALCLGSRVRIPLWVGYGLGDGVVKCCGAPITPRAWSEDPGMVPREVASLEVRMRCDSGKSGGSGDGNVGASGSDR